MTKAMTWAYALLAVSTAVFSAAPPAIGSASSRAIVRCQEGIADAATDFFSAMLELERRCREADLRVPGSCPAPDPARGARFRARLRNAILASCDLPPPLRLSALGFPGPCDDADPIDGFTAEDLVACIDDSHRAGAAAVQALRDGGAPDVSGLVACRLTIGRGAVRFARRLLPAVQACRNGILRGRNRGVAPADCATDDPRTARVVASLEGDFRRIVLTRCTPTDLIALQLCGAAHVPEMDELDCLVADVRHVVDDPVATHPPDLIDYEYATAPICGDQRRNRPAEECDGSDARDCPGRCGEPGGLLPCLCANLPRMRVVEHAHADLDLGASGHDFAVADGGGYLVDLWDCDGTSDLVCAVGPTCSLPPHVSCGATAGAPFTNGDAICASLGMGVCRKTGAGSMGPHCARDHRQECRSDAECALHDRCITVPHAPPLPLVQAGVAVCVQSTFTEDVTGTIDLASGDGAVRQRQQLAFSLGGTVDQPCPICGGFCAGPGSRFDPGARTPCASDADCPGSVCITDPVCSYGSNVDRPCRPQPPFGGPTSALGTPSLDCPSEAEAIGTLDLLLNPQTTSHTSLQASFDCRSVDVRQRACIDGARAGRPCAGAGDCPGGTCAGQCFCPGQDRPNECEAACVGGANDGAPCAGDAACDPPAGFCHAADCRPDPSDTDSTQEGHCTVGPLRGVCSASRHRPCGADGDCALPACPSCEQGETCVHERAQCFVNGRVERAGAPGFPERTTAATFCVEELGSAPVNTIFGLPGPGALTQPETIVPFGF